MIDSLSAIRGLLCACALGAVGCAGSLEGAHDAPIPAAEARATVQVVVDLEPSSRCEEAFDLVMYEDTGVELVTWKPPTSSCSGRGAAIRFVPGRISRDGVLERARGAAKKVEVTGR